MDFVYYIVRKKDNTILDGASDMVNAINIGQRQGCACLIMQACVITEVGQDTDIPVEENFDSSSEVIQPDIIENENEEMV